MAVAAAGKAAVPGEGTLRAPPRHAAPGPRAGRPHQEHVCVAGPGEDPGGEGGEAAPARAAAESLPGGAR